MIRRPSFNYDRKTRKMFSIAALVKYQFDMIHYMSSISKRLSEAVLLEKLESHVSPTSEIKFIFQYIRCTSPLKMVSPDG